MGYLVQIEEKTMKSRGWLKIIILALVFSILACQSPFSTSNSNSNSDSNIASTQTSLASTLSTVNKTQATATIEASPTQSSESTNTPTVSSELSQATLQEKINSANILIYEDTAGYSNYEPIASKAVTEIGANFVYVGDAIGTFMQKMESNTKWDLIIVASEFKNSIQGNYWTMIQQHMNNDPSALIIEIFYLNKIFPYEIKPFMEQCGLEYQADWSRSSGFNPIDYEMFWVEPDSPIFNSPYVLDRFRFSSGAASIGNVGDFVKLTGGSDAKILASRKDGHTTDYGLISSCLNGTVILQTFRTHDYPSDEMFLLWQNYIKYALTNHFQNQQ
jgi:hypothetical protein